MGLDRKKLAVIHIVKRELGLSDEEYRNILEAATGFRSAKDLNESDFRRLMRYFVVSKHYKSSRNAITFRQKLFIKHLVDELDWTEQHFVNFLGKYYKTRQLEKMTRKDASKLIESLKNIQKHQRDR